MARSTRRRMSSGLIAARSRTSGSRAGKRGSRALLQGAVRALEFSGTWSDRGDLAHHGGKRFRALPRRRGLRKRVLVVAGGDQLDRAILADADAGLRPFQASAADA